MDIHDLIKFKALSVQNTLDGQLSDMMLQAVPKEMLKEHTRNVCALISTDLFNELDRVVTFLSLSKRIFIEAAIRAAVEEANIEVEKLEEQFAERYAQAQEEAA